MSEAKKFGPRTKFIGYTKNTQVNHINQTNDYQIDAFVYHKLSKENQN